MSWTKRQIVDQAFEEIGYATFQYDLAPEQQANALRKLDAMMATWNAKGLRLGYSLPASPSSSALDDETYLPDAANEATYLNLALRLAPSVGKTVSLETKMHARMAYKQLLAALVQPEQYRYPNTLPIGQGSLRSRLYSYRHPFVIKKRKGIAAGGDEIINLGGFGGSY